MHIEVLEEWLEWAKKIEDESFREHLTACLSSLINDHRLIIPTHAEREFIRPPKGDRYAERIRRQLGLLSRPIKYGRRVLNKRERRLYRRILQVYFGENA